MNFHLSDGSCPAQGTEGSIQGLQSMSFAKRHLQAAVGGTLLVVHALSAQKKASSHTDQNIEQTVFKTSNLSWNQQALQT